MVRIGYWGKGTGHIYTKRSCAKTLKRFCGWKVLEDIVRRTNKRTGNYFLTTFLTGGRANEVLLLTKDNFEIGHEWVDVYGMIVLKKFEKIFLNYEWEKELIPNEWYDRTLTYTTKKIIMTRNFPISRDIPLVQHLVDYLESLKEGEKLFKFKYGTAYRLVADIQKPDNASHGPWWPHRLRGERATQLVIEYNFTLLKLQKFFEWKDVKTPAEYVRLGTADLKGSMRRRST